MTDIVERLRADDDTPLRSKWLMRKAADEIERLRCVLRYIAYETDPVDGQTTAAAALREIEKPPAEAGG